ncbi:hypothetical protein [Methylobacterium gregans]|uniref:Uncharacterized protein n=1 Tax=Methylobacterium gregans TaxID=374424 RepID=A0AA37HPA4_9HYPH|nr:hypothetical protein [Methylobacterium gregans]MDQ0521127.1 hypothetical protein [Methylobacterium gregans]GJD79145.1 hypothetical protein NBEOAGPD_2366 [Methylobacterium gregans]
MSRHGPEPESGQRPLPECLTRFLDMPAPGAPAPAAPPRAEQPRAVSRRHPNRALRGTLVWALLYNLIGFTVIAMLWQAMP